MNEPKMIEYSDGSIMWWQNGKLHREDGPAAKDPDGTIRWYKHGKIHREDGPAVEYSDGSIMWWQNGNLHREDGPAVIDPNGTTMWWLEGVKYSFDKFAEKMNWSTEQIVEWKLLNSTNTNGPLETA